MIKCEVTFPGKMVSWKNGNFRTPLTMLVKDGKELKEFKISMKAYGIPEKMIKTTKIDKPDYKKKAKNERKDPVTIETKKIVNTPKKEKKLEKKEDK